MNESQDSQRKSSRKGGQTPRVVETFESMRAAYNFEVLIQAFETSLAENKSLSEQNETFDKKNSELAAEVKNLKEEMQALSRTA